jgi:squalene synthase HpnC
VFVALRETVRRHDLPISPFLGLLDAFRQDQFVERYATWADLLEYCRRSANPVGRLVLMLCGYRDEARLALADKTCTALQLVNFWQDVRRDVLERERVYVPREVAVAHGLRIEALVDLIREDAGRRRFRSRGGRPRPAVRAALRATIRDLAGRTQALLDEGRALWPLVGRDVRPVVRLFTLGGDAVLRKIRRMNYDTWEARPRVGPFGKAWLLCRAWVAAKGDRT